MPNWERNNENGGAYMDLGNFSLSYAPNPLCSDCAAGETALIQKKPRLYLILDGDWREQYGQLAPQGYAACKAFYESQKAEHGSRWSEDRDTEVTPVEAVEILSAALTGRSTQ